jgi:chromosome partitioning protein
VGNNRWDELDKKRRTLADVFWAVVEGRDAGVHVEVVNRVSGAVPVSLVASTPRLSDVEAEAMEADQAWRRRVGSPYLVLHTALSRYTDAFDHVLVDCPPSLGVVTLNGLALSDGYLIPVTPTPVAIAGIAQLADKIASFSAGIARPLRRYGTIINAIDSRTNLHDSIIRELERQKTVTPIWSTRIRQSVRAQEGWDNPGPRTLTQRWGALYGDYQSLAEEYLRRVP